MIAGRWVAAALLPLLIGADAGRARFPVGSALS